MGASHWWQKLATSIPTKFSIKSFTLAPLHPRNVTRCPYISISSPSQEIPHPLHKTMTQNQNPLVTSHFIRHSRRWWSEKMIEELHTLQIFRLNIPNLDLALTTVGRWYRKGNHLRSLLLCRKKDFPNNYISQIQYLDFCRHYLSIHYCCEHICTAMS